MNKMKAFEENIPRPELKHTNQFFISSACFAKTNLCLTLILFFSEEQFLDVFHEEVEGKTEKNRAENYLL